MTAKVQLITTHGIFELTPLMDETVLELLHRHQVPWTSISAYIKNCEDNSYKIFPCLEQRVQGFPDDVTLGLFYQRNINPMTYTRTNMEVSAVDNGEDAVTEYLYRDMKSGAKAPTVIKKLSVTECRAIVTQRVHEMLDAHLTDSDVPVKIIVGVSGGGDSNALISAMSRYQSKKIELHPVIVCGPGEWDSGIPRAKEICNDLGLELTVIGEKETREILRAVPEGAPLIDRFTKVFPDEDYEFFGTLLIRLALSYVAADREADYICTGLNFEDLLAEEFARLLGSAIQATQKGGPYSTILRIGSRLNSPRLARSCCRPPPEPHRGSATNFRLMRSLALKCSGRSRCRFGKSSENSSLEIKLSLIHERKHRC